MRFEYEWDGISKTMTAIRRGIKDGMEESADDLLDIAQDEAQDTIMRRRRIWRHEVYSSFFKDVNDVSPTKVTGTLTNYAPHAEVVNYGRTPGETAPQVQHIIEWVDDNINGGWTSGDGSDGYGGGDGPTIRTTDDDTGTLSTDTDPDGPKSAQELSTEFGLDSTYFVDNPSDDGVNFRRGNHYVGQTVISYEGDGYHRLTVKNVIGPDKIRVQDEDGVSFDIKFDAISDPSLVAGEDWDQLSEDAKWQIVEAEFDNLNMPSSFPDYYKDDIRNVMAEYQAVIPDATEARDMAQKISEIKSVDPASDTNPHVVRDDFFADNVEVALYPPDHTDTKRRKEGKLTTIRHEMAHAYAMSRGSDYMSEARSDKWGQVQRWKDTRSVKYNYVEQGFPDAYTRDDNEPAGPPHIYMLLSDEEKDADRYTEYEEWRQHIIDEMVVEGRGEQEPDWEPFFDGRNDAVLGDGGAAGEGSILRLNFPDAGDEESNVYVQSGRIYDSENDLHYFEVKALGEGVKLYVDDNGVIQQNIEFRRFAGSNTQVDMPAINEDDITPDPGFQAENSYDRFREGLNRAFFRQTLASELMNDSEAEDFFFKSGYSATNGQETIARFMEIYLERGDSETFRPDFDLRTLYENHPDLLWAANQHFGAPSWLQTELADELGKDWSLIELELEAMFE